MQNNIRQSAEDYLETILILRNKNGHVRAVDIAAEMNFSKPSVSVAMKKLRTDGYIEVSEDGEITLTVKGSSEASRVLERHATIAGWLVQIGVSPVTAAEDACRLEHILSVETYDAIKNYIAKQESPQNSD